MASSGRRLADIGDKQTWGRLGELLADRRGHLGYKHLPPFWRERVERAGHGDHLSERTLRDIENNSRPKPGRFLRATLSLIAEIYGVTEDSMLAVAAGEADRLVLAEAVPPPEPLHIGGAPAWMTEEEKRRLQPWSDEIWERLVKHGENASGAELFGKGTQDAADWDAWKARGVWSLREMVAMAAEVRRRTSPDTRAHPNSGTALPQAARLVCVPQHHLCVTRAHVHPRRLSRSVFFSPRDMNAA